MTPDKRFTPRCFFGLRHGSLTLWLGLTLAISAYGQQSGAIAPPNGQASFAPATLTGQTAQHEPLEFSLANYLVSGVTFTQIFTDNAALTSNHTINDWSNVVAPHFGITHSAPRLSYNLELLAGFIVNRTLAQRNQDTENATLDLSYRAGRFTTLRLSDNFLNSTGLWSGNLNAVTANPGGGGVGVIQSANSASLTFAQIRTNTVLAELSHQFTLRSTGGIRATQSFTWYPISATSSVVGQLYGGKTYSAEAFYNYRITTSQWIGFIARAQRFDLDHSAGRTDTVSSLLLYGINVRPGATLSFFAGPELSSTSVFAANLTSFIFPEHTWFPVTGSVFSLLHHRTGATASFTRQISNGGGMSSAVTLTTATGLLSRQLSSSWKGQVSIAYTRNDPLVRTPSLRTYTVTGQVTSQLTPTLAVTAGYSRDNIAELDTQVTGSADRAWISLSYNLVKSLGR